MLFYHKDSPTFKFDNYCHRHLTDNNDLNRLKVPLVIGFISSIRASEFQLIKPSILNDLKCNEDLQKAITKFKTQIITICKYDPNKT
jgi:hypothetical protein